MIPNSDEHRAARATWRDEVTRAYVALRTQRQKTYHVRACWRKGEVDNATMAASLDALCTALTAALPYAGRKRYTTRLRHLVIGAELDARLLRLNPDLMEPRDKDETN